MKTPQIRKVEMMLSRPQGCTMMELIHACNTSTPTRRLSDLRENGWDIKRVKVEGKNYSRFFGWPPKKISTYKPETTWVK